MSIFQLILSWKDYLMMIKNHYEIYILIIIVLAAVICYCVYTNYKDNTHIDKLMKNADKSNDDTNNNTVKAPWTRRGRKGRKLG